MTTEEILRRYIDFMERFVEGTFAHGLRLLNTIDRCLLIAEQETDESPSRQERREAFRRRLEQRRLSLLHDFEDIRQELRKLDQKRPVVVREHWHILEMRCVSLLAHILPRDAREEWLGDLEEARHELVTSHYAWWAISLITWGRVVLLGWSLIKIKYQDLGFSKKRQHE
jgi:hypothetical protein